MKTIYVIYAKDVKSASGKRYAFYTNDNIQVDDVLKSESYSSNLVVVEVVDKELKFQFPLKVIKIINDKTDPIQVSVV